MPAPPSGPTRSRVGVSPSVQHGALLRLFHVLMDVAGRAETCTDDPKRQSSEPGDNGARTA